jgi:uncharacterized membrane protein YkoI
MLRSKFIPAAMIAVMAVAGTAAAFAADGSKKRHEGARDEQVEINAVLKARTSLVQAIAVAEKQTGGKAIESGLESENGVMAYEIEVANGTAIQKVLVNLDSGQVTKVVAPDAGHEEHDD